MEKEITEFEKYKVLHSIQYPDDNLKSWIDESTFNNIYVGDWESLQECYSSLDNLMTDNNIFERLDGSDMEKYECMKENFALSFIEGNKKHAFEWLYSLAELYLEKLRKGSD